MSVAVCKACGLAFLDGETHSCQIPRRSIFSIVSLLFPIVALSSYLPISRFFQSRQSGAIFLIIAVLSELLGCTFLIVACLRSERWWSVGLLGIMVSVFVALLTSC